MANLNNFSENNIQEIIGVNTFFQWATHPVVANSSPNIRVHKQNNFVIMYFDEYSATNFGVSAFISPVGALPLQYRPATTATGGAQTYYKMINTIQIADSLGAITITSGGTIAIYADPTLTPFSGGGTIGWRAFSVEYMTA
jgi:hypothetical protein